MDHDLVGTPSTEEPSDEDSTEALERAAEIIMVNDEVMRTDPALRAYREEMTPVEDLGVADGQSRE